MCLFTLDPQPSREHYKEYILYAHENDEKMDDPLLVQGSK